MARRGRWGAAACAGAVLALALAGAAQAGRSAGAKGRQWALLIAGSNGYGNYRHQVRPPPTPPPPAPAAPTLGGHRCPAVRPRVPAAQRAPWPPAVPITGGWGGGGADRGAPARGRGRGWDIGRRTSATRTRS